MAEDNLSLKDLAHLISNINVNLNEKFNKLELYIENKLSSSISEVKRDITVLSKRQDFLEDKFERIDRQMHLTDLLVNGIPKVQNEDLYQIFETICNKINFHAMDFTLLSIFRCNNKSNKATIILKFISSTARNKFYESYINMAKKKPFVLSDIGFDSNDRFYIQESLSSLNSSIHRKAIELKKQHRIFSVFTQNGFVKVKRNADTKAIQIVNILQLTEIERRCSEIVSVNKRNNISLIAESSLTENDTKLHKSYTPNNQHKMLNSTPISVDSASSNSSLIYTDTTMIAKHQSRGSSSKLDGYI